MSPFGKFLGKPAARTTNTPTDLIAQNTSCENDTIVSKSIPTGVPTNYLPLIKHGVMEHPPNDR
jgi:hypothetical protein